MLAGKFSDNDEDRLNGNLHVNYHVNHHIKRGTRDPETLDVVERKER